MKTSELTGVLLDYWVAKAEGYEPWAGATMPKGDFMWKAPRATAPTVGWLSHKFSQDWALAGPIIERSRMTLSFNAEDSRSGAGDQWIAYAKPWTDEKGFTGPTPLIAAMRAYVALKFGDEVLDPKDIRN